MLVAEIVVIVATVVMVEVTGQLVQVGQGEEVDHQSEASAMDREVAMVVLAHQMA